MFFRFPIPLVLLSYVTGIALSAVFPSSFLYWLGGFACALLASAILLAANRVRASAALMLVSTIFLGATLAEWGHPDQHPNHHVHQLNPRSQSVMVIISERLRKTRYERYVADVMQIDGNVASGKTLVYAPPGKPLPVGAIIVARASLRQPSQHVLPGSFEYKRYLERQRIYSQLYLTRAPYHVIGVDGGLAATADRIRTRISGALAQSGCRPAELHVISALLLGQQQDIDNGIMEEYRAAGAVHILSVSGLHVGFVALLIGFAMRPVPNTPGWRETKLAITVAALWGFALLAGLSPSVVRSATMFSLLTIGMHLRRPSNIYHTLAASALIILLCNPMLLYDVGFQLSYAALVFIVWLQPLLAEIWEPRFKAVKYLWDVFTVSVAAQLGTMPLSLYYFHQFPTLFFVTNLIVIPLLSIIMFNGVIAVIPALFASVPVWLVKPLEWQVWLMNLAIRKVSEIDGATLINIPMNLPLMIALYVVIILSGKCLEHPGFRTVMGTLAGIVLVQCTLLATLLHAAHTDELVVANQRRATVVYVKNGRKVTFIADSISRSFDDYSVSRFAAQSTHQTFRHCEAFNGTRLFITDSARAAPPAAFDVLVLRNNPRLNLDRILQRFRPKMVIADETNYPSWSKRWSETCQKQKIPFHDIREKGPYVLKR